MGRAYPGRNHPAQVLRPGIFLNITLEGSSNGSGAVIKKQSRFSIQICREPKGVMGVGNRDVESKPQ